MPRLNHLVKPQLIYNSQSVMSHIKICKWLDLNKLHLNVAKSKFMLFHMPQKVIPQLHFSLNGSPIDYVTELIVLGLTLDCNFNVKSHLKTVGTKIARVIGLLHKLKYIFSICYV